jgi:hypothetical protein
MKPTDLMKITHVNSVEANKLINEAKSQSERLINEAKNQSTIYQLKNSGIDTISKVSALIDKDKGVEKLKEEMGLKNVGLTDSQVKKLSGYGIDTVVDLVKFSADDLNRIFKSMDHSDAVKIMDKARDLFDASITSLPIDKSIALDLKNAGYDTVDKVVNLIQNDPEKFNSTVKTFQFFVNSNYLDYEHAKSVVKNAEEAPDYKDTFKELVDLKSRSDKVVYRYQVAPGGDVTWPPLTKLDVKHYKRETITCPHCGQKTKLSSGVCENCGMKIYKV